MKRLERQATALILIIALAAALALLFTGPAPDEPKVLEAEPAPPFRNAPRRPSAQSAQANPASGPASASEPVAARQEGLLARFPSARTIATRDELSADGSRLLRVTLLQTDLKHPLVRVEERFDIHPQSAERSLIDARAYAAQHLIAEPLEPTSLAAAAQSLQGLGMSVTLPHPHSPVLLLAATIGAEPEALADLAENLPESVRRDYRLEPDFLVFASALPDDPFFANDSLWALRNLGNAGGVAGADISATQAWDLRREAQDVIVGVVDTGVRVTHEDLRDNLWTNPGEIPANGLDDDGNGVIDDVHGFDAVDGDGSPSDSDGHGTHVAGTIGARGNNGIGTTGVSWEAQIMALRFMDGGRGFTSDAIAAIEYARAQGASILNNSWGGSAFSTALRNAIQRAADADILFVAAAGNDARDNDSSPSYPASYGLDNIIAVAATDRQDRLAPFSNRGRSSVHLAAPGAAITSTTSASDSSYSTLSGTSMAAPHVAGAAALLRAEFPQESALDVKRRLMDSVQPLPELLDATISGGRLDLFAAIGRNVADRPGVIGFEQTAVTAPETAPDIAIVVTRRAGSDGDAAIRYETQNRSASAGQDYQATVGELRWDDGDSSERFINIPLIDDAVEEGEETFAVLLSPLQGEVSLGIPSEIAVKLLDNELEPVEGFQFGRAEWTDGDSLAQPSPSPQIAAAPDGRVAQAVASIDGDGKQGVALSMFLPDGSLSWKRWYSADQGVVQGRIAIDPSGRLALAHSRILTQPSETPVLAPVALAIFAPDGSLESEQQLVAPATGVDLANAIRPTGSGGFQVAGQADILSGGGRALLIQTDPDGNPLWERRYRFRADSNGDALSSLAHYPANDTALAGGWTTGPADTQAAIIAIRPDGSERWRRVFSAPVQQRILSMASSQLGDIYAGLRAFDNQSGRFNGLLLKIAPEDGSILWQRAQSLGEQPPNFLVATGPDRSVTFVQGSIDLAQETSTYRIGRLNRLGSLLFESSLDANAPIALSALEALPDGGFAFSGSVDGLAQIGPSISPPAQGPIAFLSRVRPAANAPTPTISFEVDRISAAEDAGQVSIAVIRSAGFSQTLEAEIAIVESEASPGEDFLPPTQGLLRFEANQQRAEISIAILDDRLHDPGETIVFDLGPATPESPLAIEPAARLALTIIDNDTPFDEWAARNFSDEATSSDFKRADPDQDGLSNLAEYAFGSDPNQPSAPPRIEFSPAAMTGGPSQLIYLRAAAATDIVFRVLESSDLENWAPARVREMRDATQLDKTLTTIDLEPAMPERRRRFLRLGIEHVPPLDFPL